MNPQAILSLMELVIELAALSKLKNDERIKQVVEEREIIRKEINTELQRRAEEPK